MLSPLRTGLAALVLGLVHLAGVAAAGGPGAPAVQEADAARGRTLYLEGRHADGTPLRAHRAGGLALAGAEAACVNCHRRSGLGGAEGRSYIPPITADSLFQSMPAGKGGAAIGTGRPAYDAPAIGNALRGGIDPTGRPLDFLMPRYALPDDDVRALVAYLRELSDPPAQHAGQAPLHFATIVAPGVPPERSQAMLGVLQACIDEHNAGPQPERGRKKLAASLSPRSARPWQLDVWTLRQDDSRWEDQLAEHARRQPVFAVLGGIGGGRWSPVHAFCEASKLPCLFPQVEAPVPDGGAFYPVYLGQGVLLEAGLVAHRFTEQPPPSGRIVQVLREHDEAATAGAEALRKALAEQGLTERTLRIAAGAPLGPALLAGVDAQDALVLWLRPPDLQALEGAPPPAAEVVLSATLAQRDAVPLAAAWKERALMAYPFELPQKRAPRMATLRAWLRSHEVAPGDERVQADAYVACAALRTAMQEIEDHPGRDYLVERLETLMERSTATGLYPRLALGIGQRFASKAGYLVRFEAGGGGLVPVGERVAP